MTRLFGFTQLDLPGVLPVADGRYVIRDGETERVLVLQTLGVSPPPRRRRRRAREVEPGDRPELPLTLAMVVRAHEPFDDERDAGAWLEASIASEETIEALLTEALDSLNRALHTQTTVSGEHRVRLISPHDATSIRIGYGSGEQVAMGDFADARELDPQAGASSKRRRHEEELRPQERIAAVLGDRERIDPCEPLLLRARADLDAGRDREAALQLRIGLEALLAQLTDPPTDSGHDEDMATLEARRTEVGEIANAALLAELDTKQLTATHEIVALCERVLRRRRVLRG